MTKETEIKARLGQIVEEIDAEVALGSSEYVTIVPTLLAPYFAPLKKRLHQAGITTGFSEIGHGYSRFHASWTLQ